VCFNQYKLGEGFLSSKVPGSGKTLLWQRIGGVPAAGHAGGGYSSNPKVVSGAACTRVGVQAGSLTIDAAVGAKCPTRDQRDYLRHGACDIEAFEFGGTIFTPSAWVYLPLVRR